MNTVVEKMHGTMPAKSGEGGQELKCSLIYALYYMHMPLPPSPEKGEKRIGLPELYLSAHNHNNDFFLNVFPRENEQHFKI